MCDFKSVRSACFLLITVLLICNSCIARPKTVKSFHKHFSDTLIDIGIRGNAVFVVDRVIDINNGSIKIPENVSLRFTKEGLLCNGRIIGCNTKLTGNNKGIFRNVEICGSWDVPLIKSSLFQKVDSVNVLKNVFALASSSIRNKIIIEQGIYKVSVTHFCKSALTVLGKTEIVLNGIIQLVPNDLKSYNIINIVGSDVYLHGKGSIIGDKQYHLGTEGEWGHGVNVSGYGNTRIHDISIRNCWGDCVYVRTRGKVYINNCKIDNGRRQGISVTKADSVYISNCLITNVSGKSPQYAIDIEPNKKDTIKYVCINKCVAKNCKGGFVASGRAKGSDVRSLVVDNCHIEGHRFYPFAFNTLNSVTITNCSAQNTRLNVKIKNVKKFRESGNMINGVKKTFFQKNKL